MNLVKIEEQKNNIIKKQQKLAWEARYRLSELGIKVVSVLISMIRVNDEDFHQYTLKISDFKELIGSSSKNTYDYTHRLIKELLSKTLKIEDEQFAWISYGKYTEGENFVTFEISRHLKPYLLALQGDFLEYNIKNILPLKSTYIIRFYELLKSKWSEYEYYHNQAKSFTFELKIDWLREHFEIPVSYQYSSHVKKRIIDKAQKDFKAKTDIQFDYKEQKIGRRVDRLIITVKVNSKGSNDFLSDEKSFISYMRKNYINADVLSATDKDTGKKYCISIAPDGKIYDKFGTTFQAKRSKEMWAKLYELARDEKLLCLKQGKLF